MFSSWHQRIARELVACTPAAVPDEGSTVLEAEFGRARAVAVYVLELARAHRLPATGGVAGDDIWVQLGDDRVRFTLNRRDGTIALAVADQDRRLKWSAPRRLVVDASGLPSDVEQIARSSIESLIGRWRSHRSGAPISTIPPQPALEHEDEPTKG